VWHPLFSTTVRMCRVFVCTLCSGGIIRWLFYGPFVYWGATVFELVG
jgi:hypothetical protein